MMSSTWPQQQDAACLTGFAQATPPSPQKTLPMVAYQQLPQQQVGNPQASISAPSSTTTPSQFDPSAVWAMMNAMAHMAIVQARGAAQQQPHTLGQQQQAPSPLPEPQKAPSQPPASPASQPTQYMQAQVQ